MPKIRKIEALPVMPKQQRTAAYVRVSSGKDAMLHSLSAQVSYYSDLIQQNPEWQYAGVYADEAISGTKDDRGEFQRLMDDCREGRIDLIITKSISRFARNTVTLLQTTRELKELGIDVYFEEQNIHTLSPTGEMMLTLLASFAQEESRSTSENMKWRIQKNFEEGKPWSWLIFGYRYENGHYVIVPEEAEIVKSIFNMYISGIGRGSIAAKLNADGLRTRSGLEWTSPKVATILKNYNYTGNLILQKTYRKDYMTKRSVKNNGELPKYHAEETHEPIISVDQFNRVQQLMRTRTEKYGKNKYNNLYPFSGLMTCGCCGKRYHRKTVTSGIVWICSTYNSLGKAYCPSKQVPDQTLTAVTSEVLGGFSNELVQSRIQEIRVCDNNRLIFVLDDGTEIERIWQDRSRRESWTPEMKEAARRKSLERSRENA